MGLHHTEHDRLIELEVVPRIARFAADDPRSLDELAELYDAMRSVVTVRARPAPPGIKGVRETVDGVVVALVSLNLIGHLVEVFKAWLNRDRVRRLDIFVDTPGGKKKLHISGTDLDPDEARRWLEVTGADQFLRDK